MRDWLLNCNVKSSTPAKPDSIPAKHPSSPAKLPSSPAKHAQIQADSPKNEVLVNSDAEDMSIEGAKGQVDVIGESPERPGPCVTPTSAPENTPNGCLATNVVEFDSTTSSFLENVNSFCLDQNLPPPAPENPSVELLEFNSTTSSYLANINSYCAGPAELTSASSENSDDPTSDEHQVICVAEWMETKPLQALQPSLSVCGLTNASNIDAACFGELNSDKFNSFVASAMPGCLCTLHESCVTCGLNDPCPADPPAVEVGLWDHLVAISRCSFSSSMKRKALKSPQADCPRSRSLSQESLIDPLKKLKLFGESSSVPSSSVPHASDPSENGMNASSSNLGLPDSLLQEHAVFPARF